MAFLILRISGERSVHYSLNLVRKFGEIARKITRGDKWFQGSTRPFAPSPYSCCSLTRNSAPQISAQDIYTWRSPLPKSIKSNSVGACSRWQFVPRSWVAAVKSNRYSHPSTRAWGSPLNVHRGLTEPRAASLRTTDDHDPKPQVCRSNTSILPTLKKWAISPKHELVMMK